eukprot:CAMPEP_0196151816 /NCGR_PEP_ID=MMETSP0910-20130528/34338_1 /TAXON_ID=49265 /ORGANISM="Thalassiosira rotula, Strain GSO102" /LENGTH=88 /DNA_ID=CAMNT_0041415263 /DNA_START=16 /DNA_END=279 /DNA_ORIENTATION=-
MTTSQKQSEKEEVNNKNTSALVNCRARSSRQRSANCTPPHPADLPHHVLLLRLRLRLNNNNNCSKTLYPSPSPCSSASRPTYSDYAPP